jgi:predicted pyridoxine 5'-phosphate oxidase superfamily flavin-nucleotide-binding protein
VTTNFYHSGQRNLQSRFGSEALADRLADVTHRTVLTDDDRAFIESRDLFFLATSDADGRPDCSFKGGPAGFVKAPAPDLIVWPDYDGNGMFRSLGNIAVNPHVGLLFIAFSGKPRRLRVNGRAEVVFDDALMAAFPGAQMLVRLKPEHVFPNCPRYIPDLEHGVPSAYIPKPGELPVEPAWKNSDAFRDVVPPRKA